MRKLFSQPSSTAAPESSVPATNTDSRPSHSQNSTYSAGTSIACLDRSLDGSRAAIAGSRVFKVIRIDGSNITEELDLRAAIIAHATPQDSSASTADQLHIRAIKWDHGVLDTTLITACANGKIMIYDLKRVGQQGFEVARVQEHFRQVHALAVNPFKPNWLLTAGHDGTVKSFDLRGLVDGRNGPIFRGSFKCNADSVRDVAWSSTDGMQFACCTDAGMVQKWDIRKPDAPVLKIAAHRNACFSISWHPDGEHVVSGGSDQYCYVWNVSNTAERNQKPKYSFVTPAPIAHVAWRPATWSTTAQARRAAQVAIAYDDSNSNRMQNATVHLWDVARSALPFKEIDRWDSAPRGMLWNSRDILWSVGRDGNFVQTDVAFSPRVIDRRGLSTFSLSPQGDLLMLLEGRQSPRRVRASINSVESSPPPSHTSSSGPHLSVSRSDSEEDVVGSFLAPRQRPGHRRRLSGRSTLPLSTTPPSAMTAVDTKIMPLDDAVQVTGHYIPQQVLALGHIPVPITHAIYNYISRKYLLRMERASRTAQTQPMSDHLISIMEHCAKAADSIGHYRLAQTWRLLAFTMNLLLMRRAQYHRKSRLAIIGKEYRSNRSSPVPISHTPERIDEAPPAKPDNSVALRSKANSLSKGTEEMESTSNVATPLVRPADDSIKQSTKAGIDISLAEPDNFALSSVAQEHSSPTPIPISASNQSYKSPSSNGGYDFYGVDFFSPDIEVGAPPKKKPLRLNYPELEGHPLRRLARHNSGESFQMFSSSGDSVAGRSISSSKHEPRSMPSEAASLRQSVSNWENSLRSRGIMVPAPPATSESSDDLTTPPNSNEAKLMLANGRPHRQISPPMLRLSEASVENLHAKERPRSAGNLSDNPEIIEDDYLPWPEDPDFIISPIDPTVLVQRTIDFEAQTGSVNSAALVLLLRPYLPGPTIPKAQAVAILRQHHHRLMQQKLFTTAALLRNLCVPIYPSVFSPSQSSTSIGFFCTSCQKPLENDPLIPQSVWCCPRCLQAVDGCAICRHRELPGDLGYDDMPDSQPQNSKGVAKAEYQHTPPKSTMWFTCPGCGHGGHTICMRAWHSGPPTSEGSLHSGGCCPVEGCLHPCLPGEWREQRNEEQRIAKARELEGQVRENVRLLGSGSKKDGAMGGVGLGVRKDPKEVGSSRAVEGVRAVLGGEREREKEKGDQSPKTLERRRSVRVLAPGEED